MLYERINVTECVWSAKSIRDTRFDVDHVIPFVLWRNNDLWNLLPAHPSVNNAKRDFLPAQSLLRRRRDAVIGYWEALRDAFTTIQQLVACTAYDDYVDLPRFLATGYNAVRMAFEKGVGDFRPSPLRAGFPAAGLSSPCFS